MAGNKRVVADAVEHQAVRHIMAVTTGYAEIAQLRTVGEGADADTPHRGGDDDIVDVGATVEGKGTDAFQPLRQRHCGSAAVEAKGHRADMSHIRWHIDCPRHPVGHDAKGEAVLAVEPAVDGAIVGVLLVHRDACQAPCPESGIAVFLKTCRKVQRIDVRIEKGVVAEDTQRVGQLQRGEITVVEAIRPDDADSWGQRQAGDIAAVFKSRLGQSRHSVGSAVVLHRLRDGDGSAVGTIQHVEVRQHLDGLS